MKRLLLLLLCLLYVPAFAQITGGASISGGITFSAAAAPAGKTPDQVTGLVAWWKADGTVDCSGACSNGSAMNTMTDASGNGYTMTATGGTHPSYQTNVLNSKPAILFTAANSSYFVSYTTGNNALPATATYSIFAVFKVTDLSAWRGLAGAQTSAADGEWAISTGTPVQRLYDGVTNWGSTTIGTSAFYYATVTRNASTIAYRLNGATDGSGASSGTTPTNGFYSLGEDTEGNKFNGYIAEMFVYNNVVGSTDITALELYLKTKYGL